MTKKCHKAGRVCTDDNSFRQFSSRHVPIFHAFCDTDFPAVNRPLLPGSHAISWLHVNMQVTIPTADPSFWVAAKTVAYRPQGRMPIPNTALPQQAQQPAGEPSAKKPVCKVLAQPGMGVTQYPSPRPKVGTVANSCVHSALRETFNYLFHMFYFKPGTSHARHASHELECFGFRCCVHLLNNAHRVLHLHVHYGT
jgi:hypothetical protein